MDSVNVLVKQYHQQTPQKLKIIDAYLLYLMLTGAIQFTYCILVTNFPFNAFISGFASCVGQFVLTGEYICFVIAPMLIYSITTDSSQSRKQNLIHTSITRKSLCGFCLWQFDPTLVRGQLHRIERM